MSRKPPKPGIRPIVLDAKGYDANGAYYGPGAPVFLITWPDGREQPIRARSLAAARAKAEANPPAALSPTAAPTPAAPAADRGKLTKGALKARSAHYEIRWQNPVDQQIVTIRITHTRNYLTSGTDHIQIEAKKPKRAPLPITDTGYLSHFIDFQQLNAAGGPVSFVEAWLARETGTKDWRRKETARRQGDLFAWADAKAEVTPKAKAKPTRPAQPKASPPRPPRKPS